MRSLFITILYFYCFTATAFGPEFNRLTPQDGLNNGTINDIAQDSYGQMWFATWDGLMRFDGYHIKNYRPVIGDSESLPAKQCAKLFFDSRENFWIITLAGICRYDKYKDKFFLYNIEDQREDFNSARIYENNNMLLIIFNGSLYYLELDSIHQKNTFQKLPITDLKAKPFTLPLRNMNIINNELWFSCRLNEKDGKVYNKIFVGRIETGEQVSCKMGEEYVIRENITSFISHNDKKVFIGTTKGLYSYDIDKKSAELIAPTFNMNIRDLFISSDNKLWIGTIKSGLAYLDLHNGKFSLFKHDPNKNNSILSNIIYSLYEDFSGNLWIGHGGEGLNILNIKQKPFETFTNDPNNKFSISSNTILCFNETSNEILIGTLYDGLVIMKYNSETEEYTFRNMAMPEDFVRDLDKYNLIWKIIKESDSLFWMGTNIGIIKASKKGADWKFEQFLAKGQIGTVRNIFIDKNKNMWLGCYDGLYLITSSNRSTMEYFYYGTSNDEESSLSDLTVIDILLDKSGNFWVGTQNGGLNLLSVKYEDLDLTGKQKPELKFIHYKADTLRNNTLINNEINVLYEHQDGILWIGTQGGGINIFDHKNNNFRYISVEDGLAGEDVFSLLPDGDGNLWISTNKGLSCYNLYERKFNNYTPSDGLQGNIFMLNSYFKSSTGKLFFGGRNGFTSFLPSAIVNNEVPPKIILNEIKIFNEGISIGEKINGRVILPQALSEMSSITLTHKEYIFSIRFSVFHYQNPKENMAEYILEGFNKGWTTIPASGEFLTFNNLPHGTYTLKIRGRNSDNVWSEEIKELKIIILPPWWKTWWAKMIFLTLVISFIAGIMALILHRQSLRHLLKIEKIEFENLKELNEAKLRFFTNVSHELRTPLSLTIAPIENLILRKDFSEIYVRKQLNLAHRNAKLLIRLINQIIDFRRLNAGKLSLELQYADITQMLKEVARNFEVFQSEKRINLSLNVPEESFYFWFDSQKMEQVLYNLLSNAFKFTPAGGNIIITLKQEFDDNSDDEYIRKRIKLMVYNDGNEIPEKQIDKIFERFYKIDNNSEGSGIGLSFTKSLVELHKGKIFAESLSGKGVRFTVLLPQGESNYHIKEKSGKPAAEETHSTPDGNEVEVYDIAGAITKESDHDLCILIIEDNDELRNFLTSFFAQNYRVLEAENGQEGLKAADEAIPDIIICDIVMPVMDGLQLCEIIKKHTKTSHIPVILLTAKDTQEYKISGYDHGADAYVTKPFEITVLDRQIKSLIRNRELIRDNYRKHNFVIDMTSEHPSRDDLFIAKLKETIEENLPDVNFNVNHLSKLLSLSNTQVYRKVKALTGYSPVEFIRIIRLGKAVEMLKTSGYSVKEVCYNTGFNNPSYFIKCFKDHYKVTPNVYVNSLNTDNELITNSN